MNQDLKQIQCDDMCGFMVRSHDEKEVMQLAKQHVKNVHKMDVSDTDMRKKMQSVPEPTTSTR